MLAGLHCTFAARSLQHVRERAGKPRKDVLAVQHVVLPEEGHRTVRPVDKTTAPNGIDDPGEARSCAQPITHFQVKQALGASLAEQCGARRRALAVAKTESVLGATLLALNCRGEAQPLLSRAYASLLAQRGPGDRRTREARTRLGH
jgi:hypothetical protein